MGYASEVKPLYDILKQKSVWRWTSVEQQVFESLKKKLSSVSLLTHFRHDLRLPLEVHTDASGIGLGAALFQTDLDGERRPVSFASRTLSDAEQRYSTTEKEALAVTWAVTQKFYVYLQGRHFTVITDHAPLCGELKLQKPSTARLARMIMKLQEYDLEIKYSKGKENVVADALSRVQAVVQLPVGRVDLRRCQEEEPDLFNLIAILRKHPHQRSETEKKLIKGLNLYNGLLCCGEQIVLPTAFRHQEMQRLHEKSHFGPRKICDTLRETFWWKGMTKDVEEYCKSCLKCQRYNPSHDKKHGFLRHVSAEEVLDVLGMDFVGPLGRKVPRNIITAIDLHSRYGFAKAVQKQDAESIMVFLQELIDTYGVPKSVLTDNASQFQSQQFTDFCSNYGIEHKRTSVNRPQANGACEKFNGTLLASLAKVTHRREHWCTNLSKVVSSYNQTVHSVTGVSPFEAMFLRKPRTPTHSHFGITPISSSGDLREVINARTQIAQEKSRLFYNSKRRPPPLIKDGDLVWVKEGNRRRGKLQPRWRGPFPAKNIIEDVYSVEDRTVNIDRLKLLKSNKK
jgi:hypothetical protein